MNEVLLAQSFQLSLILLFDNGLIVRGSEAFSRRHYITVAKARCRVTVCLGSAIRFLQVDIVQHNVVAGNCITARKFHGLITL